MDDADFLTIVTQVFNRHNLMPERDWFVKDHVISVEANISKAEEVQIALEISEVVEG